MLTGGIPAEYVGAPGLLSSVITKSGTEQFSGSVNYFLQNDGLVAENRNAADLAFSRFDAAVTGGGPIVANEAWFFGSYRRLERSDTVVALDGADVIRSVENTQDQFYGRGTWAPTTADTLSFTFLNDPTDISGSRDRDVTNARDRRRVQGGNNYHLKYNRLFGGVLVEGSYSRHNAAGVPRPPAQFLGTRWSGRRPGGAIPVLADRCYYSSYSWWSWPSWRRPAACASTVTSRTT